MMFFFRNGGIGKDGKDWWFYVKVALFLAVMLFIGWLSEQGLGQIYWW